MLASDVSSLLATARELIQAADEHRQELDKSSAVKAVVKALPEIEKEVYKSLNIAVDAARSMAISKAEGSVALISGKQRGNREINAASEYALSSILHACRATSYAETMRDMIFTKVRASRAGK